MHTAESNQTAVLVEIWESVLKRSPIGEHDDFFQLGGDSLLAAQIAARVEERLITRLPPQDIFKQPTIHLLNRHLLRWQDDQEDEIRAVARTAPPPASDMQVVQLNRLSDWKLLPLTHPHQNICLGYRITGALDEGALRESVARVCQRHEVLRTFFDVSTRPFTQVIQEIATVDFTMIDIQEPDPEKREARVTECIDTLKQKQFDCLKEPLIRFHLLRLAPSEFVFVVTTDHLIMDFWSIGLLQDEISAFYSSLVTERPYAPDPPAIQYGDFALWQQRYYPKNEARAVAYWDGVLEGFKTLGLEMPLSRPRPEKFEYRTAIHTEDITALQGAVRAFSERYRVTPFSFYVAAYAILLHKLSGKRSILLFTPSAQRGRSELAQVMGRFARSLLLRMEIDAQLPFHEFVATAAETYLRAQSNLELDNVVFNGLLPEMVHGEQESAHPLSYVAFSYEKPKQMALEGLTVQHMLIKTASGPWFDLNARVFTRDEQTRLTLVYNPDSYTPEVSRYVMDAYEQIIETALEDPALAVADVADRIAACTARGEDS